MERLRSFVISLCPVCSNSYSTRNFHGRVEKKPLILPCSHCICESCLVKELKAPGDKLRCKDCSDEIVAPPQYNSTKPETEYPVNYYLLGLSVLKAKASEDSGIGFTRFKSFKPSQAKAVKKCNECIERLAERQCLQCEVPYCSVCFTKIHESARSLRLHVSVDIEASIGSSPVRTMCPRHPSSPQQIWCDQCSLAMCTTCLTKDHCSHKAKPLEEKNKEVYESLVNTHIMVVNIAQRLKSTIKTAQTVAARRSGEPLRAERQISDFFSRLHGALLLKQHHLLASLYAPSRNEANDLRSLVSSMETTSEDLDRVLAATRLAIADRRLMTDASFPELIDQLNGHLEQPCFLVLNESQDSTEFQIDEVKILESLDQFCNLKGQLEGESRYQLVTRENLPENYTIEPLVEVTRDTLFKSPSIISLPLSSRAASTLSLSSALSVPTRPSSSLSKASSSSEVDSTITEHDATKSNYYFDELLPGCTLLAKVIHAVSPNDFYVRKNTSEKKLIDLDIRINEANFTYKKKLAFAKLNHLYMVQYSKDKKWYRARILSELNNAYQVFYIDYGNIETVPKDRIRQMPTNLYKPPGLALHCSLNGCAPIKGDTWQPGALAKMLKIIGNSPVQLTVQSKTESTLYVDVHKVDPEQGTISIQDALIFLGVAVYLSNVNVKPVPSVLSKTISNPPTLKPGEVLVALVSAIVSPDEFYIQNVSDKNRLTVLHEALQEFYGKKTDKMYVYSPKEGAIVAAMQSSNNQWYRAKIIGIPASMEVSVQYIDYGNSEQIGWQRIRQLASKFYPHHQLCYKCSLVDVSPVGNEWSLESRFIFSTAVNDPRGNSDLSVVVHSVEEEVYRVVLYRRSAAVWLCVNSILVDEGAALSTGINSTIMQYSTPGSLEGPAADQENRIGRQVIAESVKTSAQSNEPIKVHVRIVRIVSPGEFYITLDSEVDSLAQMQNSLNSKYAKTGSQLKLDKAEVGETCVAKKDPSASQWYRAYIEGTSESSAQVHLLDTGETVQVPNNQLYHLDQEFADHHDGTKRCYLGGILPPFDGEGWPLTASADFKEMVEKSKDNIFITGIKTTDESKSESIPVNLLIKEETISGALEPTKTKWTSVNNLLRKKGFAKPDGTINWDIESSFETVNKASKRVLEEIMNLPAKYHGLATNVDEAIEAVPQLAERQATAPVDLVAGRQSVTASISSGPDVVTCIPPPIMPAAWPDPLPFQKLEFIANPTNVDNNCSLFIQDFLASCTSLKKISAQLENVCMHSLPMPYDFYWNVGDTCICRYHADKKWYRGVITQVDDHKEMTVLMVDYGSIEDKVTVEDLRKMPLMTDYPIQGQFCHIKKIKPKTGNKWCIGDLDAIHTIVVEHHSHITLKELPNNQGYEIVKMTLSSGKDFFQYLVSENLARFADEDEMDVVEKPLVQQVEDLRKTLTSVDISPAMADGVEVIEEVINIPLFQEPAIPSAEVPPALKVEALKPSPVEPSPVKPSPVEPSPVEPPTETVQLKISPFQPFPAEVTVGKSGKFSSVKSLNQSTENCSSVGRSTLVTSPPGTNSSAIKEPPSDRPSEAERDTSGENSGNVTNWVLECEKAGLLTPDTLLDSAAASFKHSLTAKSHSLNAPHSSVSNTENEDNDDLFDTEESVFLPMTIPIGADKFDVDVQIVVRPNVVILQISDSNDISLQHTRMEFVNLMQSIAQEAENQPSITSPEKGMGCIAKFTADNTWYRSVVEEVCGQNKVVVRYVDYGNTETLPISELRQIKFEWTGVEVQGVEAELYNVWAPVPTVLLKEKLQTTLCGERFTAVVKEREPKLVVELYSQGSHRLAYQELIDAGVLLLKD